MATDTNYSKLLCSSSITRFEFELSWKFYVVNVQEYKIKNKKKGRNCTIYEITGDNALVLHEECTDGSSQGTAFLAKFAALKGIDRFVTSSVLQACLK